MRREFPVSVAAVPDNSESGATFRGARVIADAAELPVLDMAIIADMVSPLEMHRALRTSARAGSLSRSCSHSIHSVTS